MTIKDRIEAIALELGLKFNYGTSYDFNIQADYSQFPCVVLLEPDDLGFIYDNVAGTIAKRSTPFIQFLDLLPEGIDIAEQAIVRLPVIEGMAEKAAEFLSRIIDDSNLTFLSSSQRTNVNAIVLRDKYDAHAQGVELQIPLALTYPEIIC
jgi:hypothetical protein